MLSKDAEQRSFAELPPLSLYVHVPWCVKKCPYCDFNSHEHIGNIPEAAYIDALLEDLADEMPSVWGRAFSTIFIGGGTPSLLSACAVDRLLSGIRALTGLAPTAEVTLEANPGTFEQEKFRDFLTAGVNRLSIGIQSFNPTHLSSLGRIHSGVEAQRAVDIAQAAGFEQINLDLMFALPKQTLDELMSDISIAINSGTTHLSFYELTLEPNTYFARFPPALPDNDRRAEMQDAVTNELSSYEFNRYEVSAYARTSAKNRSRHNMNYWQFGDYVGIGAGAHGKISSAADGTIKRRWKVKHPKRYLAAENAADRLGEETTIGIEETALEFLMNALRLREGFPLPLFEQHTGVELQRWQSQIEDAMERKLLAQTGLNLHATDTGFNWLNEILQGFLPANEPTAGGGANTFRYPIIPLKALKPDT